MARPKRLSAELLQAALDGLEQQLADVTRSIGEVSSRLGKRGADPAPDGKAPARRSMSAAARKRIADAQRKRWAAVRAQAAAKSQPKRAGGSAAKKAATTESE